MANGLFPSRELKPQTWWQRATGRRPAENAFAEINNLLADAQSVRDVQIDHVTGILLRYKVSSLEPFNAEARQLYAKLAVEAIRDGVVTPEELEDLRHLRRLLGLSDTETRAVFNEHAQAYYDESVRGAVADGILTPEETVTLDQLRRSLCLDEALANRILLGGSRAALQAFMSTAIADGRLSPEEDEELERISTSLGVKLPQGDADALKLAKARVLWAIENASVPELELDVVLQRAEVGHFSTPAVLYEMRTVTDRVDHHGPRVRLKVMKGVYWTAGSTTLSRVTREQLTEISKGTLYVTSKRLILVGSPRNVTIRMNTIVDIHEYTDGFEVVRSSGRNAVFTTRPGSADLLAAMIARVARDA